MTDDTRKPTRWLNYPGDVRPVDTTRAMGPNMVGEHLWPIVAEYDAATDRTRVGLSYVAPSGGAA